MNKEPRETIAGLFYGEQLFDHKLRRDPINRQDA
ncbi:hypothetical protein J2Z75_001915 [Rhizobium herbae]|uniref:Uncharacterized protein n=1 Tax=Rhizobium herbae TaxID=508661 RepID=A0ABS4EKD3_9HYPH|nr:hypothetical protein [Rhizobium herbae]